MSWVLEIQDLQSSRKTVNTIENFWNVYRFATNQVRDESAKDNRQAVRIDGKSVFYKHFFDNNIIYTTQLLYEMTNIESFNVVRDSGLNNSNFLVWTGLRQSVPLRLRVHVPNFENILDLENFKCPDYYHLLIEQKYEKPNKWAK